MSLHYFVPCETWNAHYARAIVELLQKETPEFKFPTSTASSSVQIRQIWIQLITACRKYCKRRCTNMHHWSGAYNTTDEWLPQWRHYPAWPTPFSVAVSFRSDQWRVFCTLSLAILFTRCNQLDANLANLGAAVKVE